MTAGFTVYQIRLGDELLTYTLTRKSVKRINLRIGSDGAVRVSAPQRLPLSHIEAFILQKADAILRAIHRAKLRANTFPAPLCLCEGAEVLYLGQPLTLHLFCGQNAAVRTGNSITLTLRHPEDAASVRRSFGRWQESELRPAIESMIERHAPAFSIPADPPLQFRYRSMTSRWGSCCPADGIITLNTYLAGAPLPCVEYVLIHELTHLHHPDHSPKFYAELSAHLPDWQKRKAELDGISRRLIPQKNKEAFQ